MSNDRFPIGALTADNEARISSLEDIVIKVSYYAEITTVSGQVSIPEGSTVLLDQWANGVDALYSPMEGGKPTYEDVNTDVATFDNSGNYTLTGPLIGSSSAIIYYIAIPAKSYGNLNIEQVIEFAELKGTIGKELLDEVVVTPSGDDRGVTFLNQINVLGEMIAGVDSYPVPVAFHCTEANTTGSVITSATDVTSILQSDSGSSVGLFGGLSMGSYIMVGSPVSYEGVKVKYDSLVPLDSESISPEFYANSTLGWQSAGFMGTNSNYPYEANGDTISNHTSEQVFFGFNPLTRRDPSIWEMSELTINGVPMTYRWARFKVISTLAAQPIVEQIKLHSDRIEIEAGGIFRYGTSRRPVQLFAGIRSATSNNNIDPINEVVAYTSSFSAKYVDNEFQNGRDDGFGVIVNRRFGLDTSVDLVVAVSFYIKGTATGDVKFNFNSSQVQDGYVYDGNNPSEISSVIETISTPQDGVRQTVRARVPIGKLQSNSAIVIEVARLSASDIEDTINASVIVTNVVVAGYIWKQ